MELPNDIPTVMQNAARYFMMYGNKIPEYQREKIVELMGPGNSPVDFVVKTTELLYAISDDLDDEGREVLAQTANLAAQNGWHDLTVRGPKIVNAMKRKNGEQSPQPSEDDPAPKSEYMQPKPVENFVAEPIEEPLVLEEPLSEEPVE